MAHYSRLSSLDANTNDDMKPREVIFSVISALRKLQDDQKCPQDEVDRASDLAALRVWEQICLDSHLLVDPEVRDKIKEADLWAKFASNFKTKFVEEIRKGEIHHTGFLRFGPNDAPRAVVAGVCQADEVEMKGTPLFPNTKNALQRTLPYLIDPSSCKNYLVLSQARVRAKVDRAESVQALWLAEPGRTSKMLVETQTETHLLVFSVSADGNAVPAQILHTFSVDTAVETPEGSQVFSPNGAFFCVCETTGSQEQALVVYEVTNTNVVRRLQQPLKGPIVWMQWIAGEGEKSNKRIAVISQSLDGEFQHMSMFDLRFPDRRSDLCVAGHSDQLCRRNTCISGNGRYIAAAELPLHSQESGGSTKANVTVLVWADDEDALRNVARAHGRSEGEAGGEADEYGDAPSTVRSVGDLMTVMRDFGLSSVYSWGWGPFNTRFAVSGSDGLRVCHIDSGAVSSMHRLDTLQNYGAPGRLRWSGQERTLAVCITGQGAKQVIALIAADHLSLLCMTDSGNALRGVEDIKWSPTESRFAVLSEDRISFFDKFTCRLIHAIPRGARMQWAPDSSLKDERLLVSNSRRARIYSVTLGQVFWPFTPAEVPGVRPVESLIRASSQTQGGPLSLPGGLGKKSLPPPVEIAVLSTGKRLLGVGLEGSVERLLIFKIERNAVHLESEVSLQDPAGWRPQRTQAQSVGGNPKFLRINSSNPLVELPRWGKVCWAGTDEWLAVSGSPNDLDGRNRHVWLITAPCEAEPQRPFQVAAVVNLSFVPEKLFPAARLWLLVKEREDVFHILDPNDKHLREKGKKDLTGGGRIKSVSWVPFQVIQSVDAAAGDLHEAARETNDDDFGGQSPTSTKKATAKLRQSFQDLSIDPQLYCIALTTPRKVHVLAFNQEAGAFIDQKLSRNEKFMEKQSAGRAPEAVRKEGRALWTLEQSSLAPHRQRCVVVFKVRTGKGPKDQKGYETFYVNMERSDFTPEIPDEDEEFDDAASDRSAVSSVVGIGAGKGDGDVFWKPVYSPQKAASDWAFSAINGHLVAYNKLSGWHPVSDETGEILEVLPGTERGIEEVRPSPDGNYVWIKPEVGKPFVSVRGGDRLIPSFTASARWTCWPGQMIDPACADPNRRITPSMDMQVYDYSAQEPLFGSAVKLWMEAISRDDWDSVASLIADLEAVCVRGAAGPFDKRLPFAVWQLSHPQIALASLRLPLPLGWSLGHLLVCFNAPKRTVAELFEKFPDLLLEPSGRQLSPLQLGLASPNIEVDGLIAALERLDVEEMKQKTPLCAKNHWQAVSNLLEAMLEKYPAVGAIEILLEMAIRPPYPKPNIGMTGLPGRALIGSGLYRLAPAKATQIDADVVAEIAPGSSNDDEHEDALKREIEVLSVALPGLTTQNSDLFRKLIESGISEIYNTRAMKFVLDYKWRSYGFTNTVADLCLHLVLMMALAILSALCLGCPEVGGTTTAAAGGRRLESSGGWEGSGKEAGLVGEFAPSMAAVVKKFDDPSGGGEEDRLASANSGFSGMFIAATCADVNIFGFPLHSFLHFFCAFVCLAISVRNLRGEYLEYVAFGIEKYTESPFNLFDLFGIFATCAAVVVHLSVFAPISMDYNAAAAKDPQYVLYLLALATVCLYVRFFNLVRAFRVIGSYIRALVETVDDIKFFLMVVAIILLMFANSAFLLFNATAEGDNYVSFMTVLKEVYLFGMAGDADFNEWTSSSELVFTYVAINLVMVIVVLNFLIAVISDTFDRVNDKKVEAGLGEMAETLLSIELCKLDKIPSDVRERWFPNHIIAALPRSSGSPEDEGVQEGKLTVIKASIQAEIGDFGRKLQKENFRNRRVADEIRAKQHQTLLERVSDFEENLKAIEKTMQQREWGGGSSHGPVSLKASMGVSKGQ
uniref:Ion transport domain-containing protein n=1 Tax=Chromera velia CCMP2878 TaxID=1169474 RepID=A0A0G4FQJ6_9ALVE|eukprot:Cvel_18083.t1-p1 / transcript=Cvel_18083.t1 / gene=Cvel_18083 / organism=Chromera_velia_CCMP2878 / gene_product=hypothetical protein / transcript_product=hypothetical protein / location=Cvel_scaffold1480:8909-30383(+) / protein_length=1885 / sequence_SO=supercontig / SO=protein_coding / is_pseudo=false